MKQRAIKYRLYPNKEQEEMFAKTFGCCRKVWNLMLSDKNKYYEENKKTLYNTPAQYKTDYPYLKEVDSLALANVQINLQKAFSEFIKRPKQIMHPKFKSKKARQSYTTNNQNGTIAVENKTIKLPKIGKVKAVIHREPLESWKLKSATVCRESDNSYYASVLYEYEDKIKLQYSGKVVGLDYKSDGLYTDSNGNTKSSPKYYRKAEDKLAKEQRKLSKKLEANIFTRDKNGRPVFKRELSECKNYNKQLLKVARVHRHISNQRLDFLHKASYQIANEYDIVCVESLNMKNMSNKGFHNGKATLDNGYGMFINMLDYKLSDRGKRLVKVDKYYPSSQICSCCGYKNPLVKNLTVREWICPECGNKHDRDYNAAVNILHEGMRILKAG